MSPCKPRGKPYSLNQGEKPRTFANWRCEGLVVRTSLVGYCQIAVERMVGSCRDSVHRKTKQINRLVLAAISQ